MYNRAHVLVSIAILKLMSQNSCGVVGPTETDGVFSQPSNTWFWLRIAFLWNLGETWNVHCLDRWKKLREYLLSNPKTTKKTLIKPRKCQRNVSITLTLNLKLKMKLQLTNKRHSKMKNKRQKEKSSTSISHQIKIKIKMKLTIQTHKITQKKKDKKCQCEW